MKVPRSKNGLRWMGGPYFDAEMAEAPVLVYDRLRYVGYSRGRSSVKVDLEGSTGRFEMFLADFMGLVSHGLPTSGVVGSWKFVKRGQNYGLAPVERFKRSHPDYGRREMVYEEEDNG
jgi:hypothetical protein